MSKKKLGRPFKYGDKKTNIVSVGLSPKAFEWLASNEGSKSEAITKLIERELTKKGNKPGQGRLNPK